MKEQEVLLQLSKIFKTVFDNVSINITKETTASDVDNWNSLNHMILVSEIENEFSIKFKLKDLNRMHNVGDMVEIIISKL